VEFRIAGPEHPFNGHLPQFADDETLFVGTESGIFRSTNGGRAWREISFPSESAPVLSLALSPDYAHDGTLVAGTESDGLFGSYDKGAPGPAWAKRHRRHVNGVVLSPQFPTKPHILALLTMPCSSHATAASPGRTGNPVCRSNRARFNRRPQGLDDAAPLLVGLVEGGVLRV